MDWGCDILHCVYVGVMLGFICKIFSEFIVSDVLVILGRVEFILDLAEFEYKYYNVILGMDWLSWYRVVLICPRARAHIPGAEMSFYCPLVAC